MSGRALGNKASPKRETVMTEADLFQQSARRPYAGLLQIRETDEGRALANPACRYEELNVFCEEMYKRLEFKSHSERLADILKWAEGWQSKNLPRSAA